MPECSRGWTNRCPDATSDPSKCTCACGGANHGINAGRVKETSNPLPQSISGQSGFVVVKRFAGSVHLFVDDLYITPEKSKKVVNHSPSGFEFGYGGSGPAQLALAILLEITDKETAVNLYQQLKWDLISHETGEEFKISIDQIKKTYQIK